MAFSSNGTKLAQLIDPEVIGAMIEEKLIDAIKFAPLAKIDTTLVGRAGSTVTLPKYAYIGQAVVVAEGDDIPIRQLSQTTKEVKIHKIANGGQISDEAVLSGYGDPVGEYVNQIVLSIADKIDADLLTALSLNSKTQYASTGSAISVDDIADALVLFGEDIDGDKVLLVDPKTYAVLRKATGWIANTDIGADIVIKGVVGMIHGCQVVVTNRIKNGNAYIVKPEALALFMKRDVLVETDRDIVNKSTVMTADKHLATYLLNDSKAITIAKNGNPLIYDATKTYALNDFCIYDGALWKCTTAVTSPEAFNDAKWTKQ